MLLNPTWPMAKLYCIFLDYIFVWKITFKLLFRGPLAKREIVDAVYPKISTKNLLRVLVRADTSVRNLRVGDQCRFHDL